jgi:hypothetical protein
LQVISSLNNQTCGNRTVENYSLAKEKLYFLNDLSLRRLKYGELICICIEIDFQETLITKQIALSLAGFIILVIIGTTDGDALSAKK